jgi:hypothetical protein
MGSEIVFRGTKLPDGSTLLADGTTVASDGAVALGQMVVTATRPTNVPPRIDPYSNVLNYFRSYTYNFTLAGLPVEVANDPSLYRDAKLDFVILKSGGKGSKGLNESAAFGAFNVDSTGKSASGAQIIDPNSALLKKSGNKTVDYGTDRAVVKSFNNSSAGRFDMFIDNVDVTTLQVDGGLTFATNISFDVFEPLSVTGFIDALHATAIVTGYPGYQGATFLLKMQFIGYSDQNESAPVEIPRSTRYFPFLITAIDVDMSETGTRYKVKGRAFNEMAFGVANQLTRPIQMSGSTVVEILNDFMKKKNEQITADDKSSKPAANATQHDIYDIIFPEIDKDGNRDPDKKKINKIGQAKIAELLRDNRIYTFADPGSTTNSNAYNPSDQESVRYEPGKTLAMFANGANISEIISAIIRDSDYLKNILKTIGKEGTIDNNGMVDFFKVGVELENLEIDLVNRTQFKKITYVVTPYKIHYTMIPGYEAQDADPEAVAPLIWRKYNYIYTGKNTDVLSFRLNFNNLFFQSTPPAGGNSDAVPSKDGAGPNNSSQVEKEPTTLDRLSKRVISTSKLVASDGANATQAAGGNAGPPQSDPYSILAKDFFTSMQQSTQYSALRGELEIIGDPFYVATGGLGNYVPKILNPGITQDYEADFNRGQVLINLNFKNPIDIEPLEKGGMMKFDPEKISFSGTYMIKKIRSHFKDGVFKQTLEIQRFPGISADIDVPVSDPKDVMKTRPNPLDQTVKDTSRALPKKVMPFLNFINGVNTGINNILSAPQRLISEAGAAIQGAANKGTSAINAALSPITKVTQKINAAVQGVNQEIFSGAEKIGLSPNQLSGLSPTQIVTMLALAKRIPDGVNVTAAENQGIIINPNKLDNLPPTAPIRIAPPAEVAPADAAVEQQVKASELPPPAVVTTNAIPQTSFKVTELPPVFNNSPSNTVDKIMSSILPITSNLTSPSDVRNSITITSDKIK